MGHGFGGVGERSQCTPWDTHLDLSLLGACGISVPTRWDPEGGKKTPLEVSLAGVKLSEFPPENNYSMPSHGASVRGMGMTPLPQPLRVYRRFGAAMSGSGVQS